VTGGASREEMEYIEGLYEPHHRHPAKIKVRKENSVNTLYIYSHSDRNVRQKVKKNVLGGVEMQKPPTYT